MANLYATTDDYQLIYNPADTTAYSINDVIADSTSAPTAPFAV